MIAGTGLPFVLLFDILVSVSRRRGLANPGGSCGVLLKFPFGPSYQLDKADKTAA